MLGRVLLVIVAASALTVGCHRSSSKPPPSTIIKIDLPPGTAEIEFGATRTTFKSLDCRADELSATVAGSVSGGDSFSINIHDDQLEGRSLAEGGIFSRYKVTLDLGLRPPIKSSGGGPLILNPSARSGKLTTADDDDGERLTGLFACP